MQVYYQNVFSRLRELYHICTKHQTYTIINVSIMWRIHVEVLIEQVCLSYHLQTTKDSAIHTDKSITYHNLVNHPETYYKNNLKDHCIHKYVFCLNFKMRGYVCVCLFCPYSNVFTFTDNTTCHENRAY